MSANPPTTIDLAPGSYSGPLPGGYTLVVGASGPPRLERPTGPLALVDLVTPTATSLTSPATPPGSSSSRLGAIALGIAIGLAGLAVRGAGDSLPDPTPAPAPIPAPVDPTPTPKRPSWWPDDRPVPSLEQPGPGVQALPPSSSPLAPHPSPLPEPEWRPLSWAPGWEGYGREIGGEFAITSWRLAQASAALPPPVAVYRGGCTTTYCPR